MSLAHPMLVANSPTTVGLAIIPGCVFRKCFWVLDIHTLSSEDITKTMAVE